MTKEWLFYICVYNVILMLHIDLRLGSTGVIWIRPVEDLHASVGVIIENTVTRVYSATLNTFISLCNYRTRLA